MGGQRWLPILLFVGAASAIVVEKVLSKQVGHLSPSEIEDQLQVRVLTRGRYRHALEYILTCRSNAHWFRN